MKKPNAMTIRQDFGLIEFNADYICVKTAKRLRNWLEKAIQYREQKK